jgi:hypothetical protein
MQIINQTPERLVFRSAPPPMRFNSSVLMLCGFWVAFGLILFCLGLVLKAPSAIAYGFFCIVIAGGVGLYDFYRNQIAHRVYSLDHTLQEFRIWGWQPLNHGWQPPISKAIQAFFQPSLRYLPLHHVQLEGPIHSTIATTIPYIGPWQSVWEVFILAEDISIRLRFDTHQQARDVKTLLTNYVTVEL